MKKRILSLFMAFVLCLTLLPTAALAASGDGSISDGVIGGSSSTGEGGGIYVPPGGSTEGGGGTYIPGEDTQAETQPVTVISGGTETGYDSIVTAFSEAADGGTIRLNADVSLEASNLDDGVTADTALAVSGKNITLDLNGYVLGSYSVPITVKSGAALTLINADGENSPKYTSTSTALKIGLRLNLLVEKGGSFTCTDGMFQSLKLLNAGAGSYDLTLAEGENHCTFGFFSSEDETATVDDVLKTNHAGMALHASYVGADVQFERSKLIKDLAGQPFYVGACSEHKMDTDGTCDYCGASYAASVTASSGESTSYTSLDDALKAVKDGDTVTLLSDAEVTMWHPLTAAITLDLNGKTVTTQSGAPLSIYAETVVQDSSTAQAGKMVCNYSSTPLLDVQYGGNLTIKSGIFDGDICARSGAGSALTIEGGTFNKEVALEASVSISLSGGTFKSIWYTGDSFLNLLADGHAFYDTDGKLVNAAQSTGRYLDNVKVREHKQHTFTDGACGCGYTCPHTSIDANGVCAVCKKQFAASVTASDGSVTYYDVFYKALNAARAGSTLTLLADVTGTTVMINDPLIFDLNGHNVDALSVDTKATIKDSGTTKGKIGTLSIHNNTDPDADTPTPTIVLGDLMTGGDSLKANGTWLTAAQLFGTSAENVSVDKTGITDVTASNPGSVVYGQTGATPITLTVTPTDIETLTFEWFELKDNNEWQSTGMGGDAYHPAALNVGSHMIRCAVRSTAGYVLSDAVTVTVTKASIAGADVSLVKSSFEYDGVKKVPEVESVILSDKTLTPNTDFYVEVTPQTDAGSYTLTVKGYGNYSGEIENVEWKIEPIKIDSVMVSSDISKVYDGTAKINMTAEEWAKVLTFKKLSAYPVVNVPNTAYTISDAYFVEKRGEETLHSPEAGEKYGITFKITLNSKNYVLQNYFDEEPATSKEYTQSGSADFTITKEKAPNLATSLELHVTNDLAKTYEVDLTALLPELTKPREYGDISGTVNVDDLNRDYYTSGAAVENGKLILPINNVSTDKTGSIGTVTVTVTSDNYQEITITIPVVAQNKIDPDAAGITVSAADIIYGQTLSASTLTVNGKMVCPRTGNEIKGTFAWTDPETRPDAAGDYTASWTFTPAAGYEEYASATGTVTVKVAPAQLRDVSVLVPGTYYYTGQPQRAAVSAAGLGVCGEQPTFTYSAEKDGAYTSQVPEFTNAGTYTVYYKVEAANHIPTADTFSVQIKPLPISLLTVDKLSKTYDGSADATLSADMLTFFSKEAKRSDITLPDTALTISNARFTKSQADGSYLPSPEVGDGKALSFTMTLESDNYVFEREPEGTKTVKEDISTDDVTKFTITKAKAPEATLRPAVTVVNGLAKTYEMVLSDNYLPKLSSPCEYGNVSYSVKGTYLTDGYKDAVKAEIVEENGQYKLKLTVPAVDYARESSVGTLDIKVVSDNYQDFTLTIGVKAKNKTVPMPDGEISATDITYGQTLADSKITGKMKDGNKEVTGTFAWKDGTIKPNAGSYEAEWTFTPAAGYEEYASVTGQVKVTVKPKNIKDATVTLAADSFVYDGNHKTLDVKSVVLDGVTLTPTTDYGYYCDMTPDVGTHKLTVSGNNNYTGKVTVQWSITPRTVTPEITVASCTYTGDALTPDVTLKDDLGNTIDPKEYTVSYSNNTNAGTGTVTITDVEGGNYVLNEASTTFTINKAAAPTLEDIAISHKYTVTTGEKTIGSTMPVDAGALSFIKGTESTIGSVTVSSWAVDAATGKVAYTLSGGTAGDTVTLPVTIFSTNYADTAVKVVITLTKRDDQAALVITGNTSVIYGEKLILTTTGGSGTGAVTYRIDEASTGDATIDATGVLTPVKVGSVSVIATKAGDKDYNDITSAPFVLMIQPATPTGEPKYTEITTGGKTLKDAALMLDGSTLKPNAGTLEWIDDAGKVLPDDTKVEANKRYTWRFTPADNNYAILTGEVELYHVSSSGGSDSTTAPVITVPVSSDKETVKVDASVSNGVATVKVTDWQLEQVTTDTDRVTVDVSGLQNVSSAKLPSSIVKKAEQSGADLTVTLPTGSVTLDAAALAAVGNGKDVTVSMQKAALTDEQRDAVESLAQVAVVVDVNVLTGTAKRSNFNGGKLTVSIPYTLKSGEDPSKLQVWFIRDDGSIENMGGSYDRKTGCFVFSTEHLSCYLLVSTAGTQRFADVPASAYYAEAVAWAVKNGITGGTSATTFDPNGFCTRAQAVTFLWRAAGSPTPKSAEMPFADVLAGSYYYDAVLWAIENGITNGTSDTTFGPNVSCSRGQIVTFLWRSQNSPDAAAANPFTDVAADAYYTNAVLWAVGKSITSGISTTTFSPSANCTRAQIVTFLCRMYREN